MLDANKVAGLIEQLTEELIKSDSNPDQYVRPKDVVACLNGALLTLGESNELWSLLKTIDAKKAAKHLLELSEALSGGGVIVTAFEITETLVGHHISSEQSYKIKAYIQDFPLP